MQLHMPGMHVAGGGSPEIAFGEDAMIPRDMVVRTLGLKRVVEVWKSEATDRVGDGCCT